MRSKRILMGNLALALILGACNSDSKKTGAGTATDKKEAGAAGAAHALTFPGENDASLVDISAIPQGDYSISEVETSLAVEKYKASYSFKQTLKNAGRPTNGDPIQTKKDVEGVKAETKTGEAFWPSLKFNLPFVVKSYGNKTEFLEVNEYGNQWFSEKPEGADYKWWWNEGEGADYVYLYKIFSEGDAKGKLFSGDLNGTIKEGLAGASVSGDSLVLIYAYRLGGIGGDAVVKITYKRAAS